MLYNSAYGSTVIFGSCMHLCNAYAFYSDQMSEVIYYMA